jgi:hypothetical protein
MNDFDFASQTYTRLANEMAMVHRFDGGFERECDKKADRDRQQVKEKVLPSTN